MIKKRELDDDEYDPQTRMTDNGEVGKAPFYRGRQSPLH